MSRYLLLAASCLVAAGCSERPADDAVSRPSEELAVYEAAFRYQLQKQPAEVRAYLSVDGKDPSADLLKRLRTDWPNLKPASEEPKEKGFSVYVKGLKWTDRDTAELEAGHWFPTRFAGEGYFGDHHLKRKAGKWVVEKVTNETMS